MILHSHFAGIGGFDLAAERVGIRTAMFTELNDKSASVVERHYPHAERIPDIADAMGWDGAPPDIATAGFPCQDLSVAGRRAGLAGSRSGLVWTLLDVIHSARPRWILLENVPGLLSSDGPRDMGALLWALGELGYGWAYRMLDAQFFGVAQGRRRLFIVGHSGGRPDGPAKVLFEPESLLGDPPPGRKTGEGITGTLGAFIDRGGTTADDVGLIIAFAQYQRDEVRELPTVVGARAAGLGIKQQSYIASHRPRRLTPLECERLQGFPDGWTDHLADTARYAGLGNAVAVPVAHWILKRLVKVDAESSEAAA
jgi:DNA (cytosine-5)-methyltransferase 1